MCVKLLTAGTEGFNRAGKRGRKKSRRAAQSALSGAYTKDGLAREGDLGYNRIKKMLSGRAGGGVIKGNRPRPLRCG